MHIPLNLIFNMTKKIFRIMWDLTMKQPWLVDKYKELENILFNECSNQEQVDLILNLLSRFEYISGETLGSMLSRLVGNITSNKYLNDNNAQIVAMAADNSADSSQYILYMMKPLLQKKGWVKYKSVNKFAKSYNTYKNSKFHKNIILVDEFIGSGKTAKSRVDEISRTFKSNGVSDFTIRIEVLASSIVGYNYLFDSGINVSSQIILPRGISDYYSKGDVSKKIESMKEMESLLSEFADNRSMPSLGYGSTESLYCREGGNSPNSVFPIFWWPEYIDGKFRPTLLTRAMGDA